MEDGFNTELNVLRNIASVIWKSFMVIGFVGELLFLLSPFILFFAAVILALSSSKI